MIEILVLIRFCKKLAAMAREKGRTGSWGAVGALGWIGGEITGAFIGFSAGATDMAPYGIALVGAVVGATIAYLVVRGLSEIPPDNGLPVARVV
jgi:hypothetical protein